jgi:hypothetical protein
MKMNQNIILDSGHAITEAIDTICTRKNFSVDERVLIMQIAMAETLNRWEGPVDAIEGLRNLADVLEQQVLGGEIASEKRN